MATTEFELINPPKDGISSIHFHRSNPSLLASTSWDKSLKVYDTILNNTIFDQKTKQPLLTCSWYDDNILAGGLEGIFYNFNLETLEMQKVGNHDAAISCSSSSPSLGFYIHLISFR